LDVAIFQSLKWNYDKEVNGWLKKHPGRIVTEAEIAERFQNAYSRAATVGNAASAFSKTGIHPFNADIFCDDDFIAADVTDIPMEPDVDGTVGSSDAIPSTSSSASIDVVAIKSPDGLISGDTEQCQLASTNVVVSSEMQTGEGSLSVPQRIARSDIIPLTSSLDVRNLSS